MVTVYTSGATLTNRLFWPEITIFEVLPLAEVTLTVKKFEELSWYVKVWELDVARVGARMRGKVAVGLTKGETMSMKLETALGLLMVIVAFVAEKELRLDLEMEAADSVCATKAGMLKVA